MQKSFVIWLNIRLNKANLLKAPHTSKIIGFNGYFELNQLSNFRPHKKCHQNLFAVSLITQLGIYHQPNTSCVVSIGI